MTTINKIGKIAIIGSGNVATHLAKAFARHDVDVVAIRARNDVYELQDAGVVIIAVCDEAIPEVVAKVAEAYPGNAIIAHTSGSVPLSALKENLPDATPCGVFYPMQTFTKDVDMRYDDIPFLIEGSDRETTETLMHLASTISSNVREADSSVRGDYHIGAVFACNFTNQMCALADEYLRSKGLAFDTLLPLLRQTLSKLDSVSPSEARTGPAARGDTRVMELHEKKLASYPDLQKIYKTISDSIIKTR